MRAYLDGIVGSAALPSAVIRIAAGALCILAAIARARPVATARIGAPADSATADDADAVTADG